MPNLYEPPRKERASQIKFFTGESVLAMSVILGWFLLCVFLAQFIVEY